MPQYDAAQAYDTAFAFDVGVGAKMFTVPSDNVVGPVALDTRDLPDPLSNRLFRWYKPRPRGRNVFILKDGTVTENLPAATYDPTTGVLISSGWDLVADDPTSTDPSLPGNLAKQVFYGGHGPYPLTAAQVTILTAAGYGANIA